MYRTEFDLNVLFIHIALVLTLRSKVNLNWTRASRPVTAQSIRFCRIAKKTEQRFKSFFPIEEKNCSY